LAKAKECAKTGWLAVIGSEADASMDAEWEVAQIILDCQGSVLLSNRA
jgi:hypothetical protein